jgi:phosphoglycerol geranylgeranyltransferase
MIPSIGKVEKYINDKIQEDGAIFHILIDPCDYSTPQKAIDTALMAAESGADIIGIGGSTGVQGDLLDFVAKGIKKETDIPIILFPGNIATVSASADAVLFMSLLNSRNPYWVSQAQMLAAPIIKKMNIEALPTGYILVEPGGTAGWVGDANLIPRNKPKLAAALALSAQLGGRRIVFTDAGSAAFEHIPLEMIAAVRKAIDVVYIVGGGIKTPQQAGKVVEAGADYLSIGTAAEETKDVKALVKDFAKMIKQKGRERIKKK